jgi:hypothetical protein
LNAAESSRAAAAALSPDVLVLAGATAVAALALGLAGPDTPAATRLLLAIATPVLLMPLFCNEGPGTSQAVIASLARWVFATLLLGIVAANYGARPTLAQLLPLLLVGLGIVVVIRLAVNVSMRLLQAAGLCAPAAHEWASWLVAAVLWLHAAAPLWLGPLAALGIEAGPARSNAIVAASPLVHLGVAAGQDLLRTQWWYAHTSFGSLQFDYPSLAAIALAYAAMALALGALDFALSLRDAPSRALLRKTLPIKEAAQ